MFRNIPEIHTVDLWIFGFLYSCVPIFGFEKHCIIMCCGISSLARTYILATLLFSKAKYLHDYYSDFMSAQVGFHDLYFKGHSLMGSQVRFVFDLV